MHHVRPDDPVVGDLGQPRSVGGEQRVHRAVVLDRGDRGQPAPPGARPHECGQRFGHAVTGSTERGMGLQPLVLADRLLQVPALVVTAVPATQRHPAGGEPPVGGVVVGGVQLVHHRWPDGGDAIEPVERRQLAIVGQLELLLDLAHRSSLARPAIDQASTTTSRAAAATRNVRHVDTGDAVCRTSSTVRYSAVQVVGVTVWRV